MTRCPRLGGYATVVGRHDSTCAFPAGRCPVLQEGLASANPNVRRAYRRGVGERQRGAGAVAGG